MRMGSPGFQLSGITKKEDGAGFSRPPRIMLGPFGDKDLTSRDLETSYSDFYPSALVPKLALLLSTLKIFPAMDFFVHYWDPEDSTDLWVFFTSSDSEEELDEELLLSGSSLNIDILKIFYLRKIIWKQQIPNKKNIYNSIFYVKSDHFSPAKILPSFSLSF